MIDLDIRHVSKRYRIRNPDSGGSPLRRLAGRFFARQHDFWALRDVSLAVRHGETMGVIGHNGAGKSTLMKLLSGITAPTDGEIRIRGRLAALIELGSGFHPELTGRENVFMSGAVMGMRRREIAGKFDSIVEFAGIGEFIDVPVKWYSSGMYVRLGFAIAAHVDVDILLVDEVLAVGDAAFQNKCFNRIADLRRSGTTIVMITHDLSAIERLAERAMLLDHGRVAAIGLASDVVATYQRAVEGGGAGVVGQVDSGATVEITDVCLIDAEDRAVTSARTGDGMRVRIALDASEDIDEAVVDLFFHSVNDGSLHIHCSSAGTGPLSLRRGPARVEFEMPALGLQPGVYAVGATVTSAGAARPCGWQYNRARLYVAEGVGLRGRFYAPHAFRLLENDPEARPQAGEGSVPEWRVRTGSAG